MHYFSISVRVDVFSFCKLVFPFAIPGFCAYSVSTTWTPNSLPLDEDFADLAASRSRCIYSFFWVSWVFVSDTDSLAAHVSASSGKNAIDDPDLFFFPPGESATLSWTNCLNDSTIGVSFCIFQKLSFALLNSARTFDNA